MMGQAHAHFWLAAGPAATHTALLCGARRAEQRTILPATRTLRGYARLRRRTGPHTLR